MRKTPYKVITIDDIMPIIRNTVVSLKPICNIINGNNFDDRSEFIGSNSFKIVPENENESENFIQFNIHAIVECLIYNTAGINIYIDIDTKVNGESLYLVEGVSCKGITLQKQDNKEINEFNNDQLDKLIEDISNYIEGCYISFFSKFYNEEATINA